MEFLRITQTHALRIFKLIMHELPRAPKGFWGIFEVHCTFSMLPISLPAIVPQGFNSKTPQRQLCRKSFLCTYLKSKKKSLY